MSLVQDTIDFQLVAEDTVINDTVKLSATICTIIDAGMTETTLKDNIREMMKQFLSETKVSSEDKKKPVQWQFSNMTRDSHPSGKEQMTLVATARVHESDNYALDKRAREVSQEGMTIGSVVPDTTPPTHMIEAAERKLRLKLLVKANEELEAVNEAFPYRTYRLGVVNFQAASNSYSNSATMLLQGASMKTAHAASYGTGFDGDDALGNAVKLTMRAGVQLRTSVVNT